MADPLPEDTDTARYDAWCETGEARRWCVECQQWCSDAEQCCEEPPDEDA